MLYVQIYPCVQIFKMQTCRTDPRLDLKYVQIRFQTISRSGQVSSSL